jgi:hypothetical protein
MFWVLSAPGTLAQEQSNEIKKFLSVSFDQTFLFKRKVWNEIKKFSEEKIKYDLESVHFVHQRLRLMVRFCTAGGSVIFKPDLKYEILIAMHVLVDPSHHRHAHEWACETLGKLSPQTKVDIFSLVENRLSEWQLSNSIRNCDVQNDIERLLNYIREGNIISSLEQEGIRMPENFPAFFASILKRFWDESFQKDYTEKYYPILLEDAKAKANQFGNTNLVEFMEKWSGRQFSEKKNLIFYPSYFIRPHAHGFDAEEGYVTVYQVQATDVIGNAIHELLHQLMSGWHQDERMKELVDKFRPNFSFEKKSSIIRNTEEDKNFLKSRKFKDEWEKKGKGYWYPEGWLEENIVMAFSTFLSAKFKGEDLEKQGGLYTDIQRDMFNSIVAKYSPERYNRFDDFLEFLAEYDVGF